MTHAAVARLRRFVEDHRDMFPEVCDDIDGMLIELGDTENWDDDDDGLNHWDDDDLDDDDDDDLSADDDDSDDIGEEIQFGAP